MDEIQNSLTKMIEKHPSCITDRKQLRAVLSDYFPQNKLHQNLIMNAYDECIIERLQASSDVTLHALQMVKTLTDECGLAKDKATWAVVTWCYMLRLNEIAEIIQCTLSGDDGIPEEQPNIPSQPKPSSSAKISLGFGMYLAGVEFPAGEIKLEPVRQDNTKQIYYAIIKKGSNGIVQNGFFKTQIYLTISEGQKLEIKDDVLLSNL